MLEIVKYGSNKYGVWVLGNLKYQDLELSMIFNTNLKDEEFFKDKTTIKPKMIKISRDRNKNIVIRLEF